MGFFDFLSTRTHPDSCTVGGFLRSPAVAAIPPARREHDQSEPDHAVGGPTVAPHKFMQNTANDMQYNLGIKQSHNSVRDRTFARGEMMNQDFAQAADKVLSNKYPDSGTTGRALFSAGAAGAGAMFTPGVLAGVSAANLLYLPGARQLIAACSPDCGTWPGSWAGHSSNQRPISG